MYIVMDMGTSNTRLSLCDNGKILVSKKGAFGAGSSKSHGKRFLFDSLKSLIGDLLDEGGADESRVERIFASGMAGSEIGLCDVARISLPCDVYKLADNLSEVGLEEITNIPFVFVPGLKKERNGELADVMRGEETEVAGILASGAVKGEAVIVLPGTHNKVIKVNAEGEITDFYTTFSGELLAGIVSGSILAGQVSHSFELSELDLIGGAEFAKENGLNAAVFHVRVMALGGKDINRLSSFLYGAVLGQDISLIRRVAAGQNIYVGGKESLKRAYGLLIGEEAILLDGEVAEGAVSRGLEDIRKLHNNRKVRSCVLDAIEREKLIAIVRCPARDSFAKAMRAIYDGGVRLAEITFDRSGKYPKEYTAEMIKLLVDEFGGEMLVGAGTVMSKEEVMMAYEAGAYYMISPNCDPEVIELTRKLGLVSIPAAFTATEISAALKSGADYIKLFPADQAGEGYVKAVKAPIADAKLLAVGGVTAENAGDFLKKGFCGVGVGSNLYNNKLVEAGDFSAITELAKKFVDAVK